MRCDDCKRKLDELFHEVAEKKLCDDCYDAACDAQGFQDHLEDQQS